VPRTCQHKKAWNRLPTEL